MEKNLQDLLIWIGRITGVVGVLMTVVAVAARLAGVFHVAGFEAGTLMQAGMAVMLVACVSYLALITRILHSRPAP
ncbi:MAG: hypothetical protein ACT4P4_05260 [Betaproteobacteria bacterium]